LNGPFVQPDSAVNLTDYRNTFSIEINDGANGKSFTGVKSSTEILMKEKRMNSEYIPVSLLIAFNWSYLFN